MSNVFRRQDSSIGFDVPVRANMRIGGVINASVTSTLLETVSVSLPLFCCRKELLWQTVHVHAISGLAAFVCISHSFPTTGYNSKHASFQLICLVL